MVLSDRGSSKILEARRASEQHENQGEPYTVEELAERTGLDPHTLSKVFNRNVKVDKRTLQLCFQAFNLTLEERDYQNDGNSQHKSQIDSVKTYDRWGEFPDITDFCGRATELVQLKQWILSERCRAIALFGQRGVGKTFLAAKLVDELHTEFDLVLWRSLDTLPPIRELLTELILSFPHFSREELAHNVQGKLSQLIRCLRSVRCLLVLDGVERVLHPDSSDSDNHGNTTGKIPECEWYRRLLKRLGEVSYMGCTIVTSCQKLSEIQYGVRDNSPKRMLQLQGLTVEDGKTLCNIGTTLQATQSEWETLIHYYGGHPLFLKMAVATIRNLFNDKVAEFLHGDINPYGEIRQYLDREFQTLSVTEQQLLCYLVQQGDRISFKDIRDQSPPLMILPILIEAFEGLEERSLIVKQKDYFILPPAIRDSAIAWCKANEL